MSCFLDPALFFEPAFFLDPDLFSFESLGFTLGDKSFLDLDDVIDLIEHQPYVRRQALFQFEFAVACHIARHSFGYNAVVAREFLAEMFEKSRCKLFLLFGLELLHILAVLPCVGTEKQEVQHNYLIEILDVVLLGLHRRVLHVYLIAHLVVALDILPKCKARLELNILHDGVRPHDGRSDIGIAQRRAKLRALIAFDGFFQFLHPLPYGEAAFIV